ncbi:MAG: hypothetical protein KAH38_00035 [Candidatus Hydrogenedentes bacterium]|nr:hypothetical protein [Candidatus Hydrogenedentota bacterium]
MMKPLLVITAALLALPVSAITTENIMTALPVTQGKRVIPAAVMVHTAVDSWRMCVPVGETETVTLHYVTAPEAVICPGTGDNIPFKYAKGVLTIQSKDIPVDGVCRKVVVQWSENRWKKDMQKFVKANKNIPPMTDGILFTGSSTARMWNVKKSFPDINTLNRGFGGSQYWDLFQYADCILEKHHPETIVFYSGDNDINAKKSPEWVLADCTSTVQRFRLLAPESRIIILAAKPSGSRWDEYPAIQQANALIDTYTEEVDKVYFLDLGYLLLNDDGKPDADCFIKDALHMNNKGYRLWSDALEAFIGKIAEIQGQTDDGCTRHQTQ